MITRDQLREYAKLKDLSMGNAEKDYLLELTLFIISRVSKDELVFKGGTALYKFYNLDRFSEDLDFTLIKDLDLKSMVDDIISGLKKFSINARLHDEHKFKESTSVIIRTEGPLYSGNPLSYSKIEIDINLKSSVVNPSKTEKLISIYREIPSFNLQIMDISEIFAEKTRAIMTRNKARDVYDLWFLIQKVNSIDLDLINNKLSYYNMKFSLGGFEKSIKEKKRTWTKDLKPLIPNIPDFSQLEEEILEFFRNQIL